MQIIQVATTMDRHITDRGQGVNHRKTQRREHYIITITTILFKYTLLPLPRICSTNQQIHVQIKSYLKPVFSLFNF